MNQLKRFSLLVVLTLAAASMLGCSFSKSSESSVDSSKSILDSASSPFKSSSDSSGDEKQEYENDVADYTAEFVTSSTGTLDNFREHVSELAKDHGITNWESDRYTYLGVGRGLKKSKLGDPQISAFTESLSGNDPMKKQAIEDGLKK